VCVFFFLKALYKGPRSRPQHNHFWYCRTAMQLVIEAASVAFDHNFMQYQGS